MANSEETGFKEITRTFFEKEWKDGFDIFYQVAADGEKKFVKFAEFDPQDYSRLDSIFKKENERFYVNETDLYKYYQFNILKHLLLELAEENLSGWEVFRAVYPVATRILQDYIEITASDSFLELLDEIPEVLSESLVPENLPFFELFTITQKENSIHTHCVNVGLYCLCLARELEMGRKDCEEICRGGLLADIGKKFIPRNVLLKQGELTEEERQTIRSHPAFGKKTLNELRRYSATVLHMAAEHHENYDGTGYPMKIAGNTINIAARICKIADVFNALTSQRTYGEKMTPVQALTFMKEDLKGQFDPDLLVTFILYAGR
ncbi:MAG: HD domain-containing protein [Nitrospinota bacterium]|nr:HD domain-containing protein [Nitrospinota bacterium]